MKKTILTFLSIIFTLSLHTMEKKSKKLIEVVPPILTYIKNNPAQLEEEVEEGKWKEHRIRIMKEIKDQLPESLYEEFLDALRLLPDHNKIQHATTSKNRAENIEKVERIKNRVKESIEKQKNLGIQRPIIQSYDSDALAWAVTILDIPFIEYLLKEGADPRFRLQQYQLPIQRFLRIFRAEHIAEKLVLLEGLDKCQAREEAEKRLKIIKEMLKIEEAS